MPEYFDKESRSQKSEFRIQNKVFAFGSLSIITLPGEIQSRALWTRIFTIITRIFPFINDIWYVYFVSRKWVDFPIFKYNKIKINNISKPLLKNT